jgi:hypothetical protein
MLRVVSLPFENLRAVSTVERSNYEHEQRICETRWGYYQVAIQTVKLGRGKFNVQGSTFKTKKYIQR